MADPQTYTARWVFPSDGPPLLDGTVTIRGDKIEAVEPFGKRTADESLGNAAILPGLVNCHTHLDLTGMRGKCPPGPDFCAWLRGVIAFRKNQAFERIAADIEAGFRESASFGTTLVGDIATSPLSSVILAHVPIRLVVFYELLGLSESRAKEAWEAAQDRLQKHRSSPTCRPGLSPHAPYSTHYWLSDKACEAGVRMGIPVASHLAESEAEMRLLSDREGPFVDFLKEMGVWDPSGLVSHPGEMVYWQRDLPLLIIHGNYFKPGFLEHFKASIIYCPRTHAAFGHPPHPFREFLARGVRVALGTDSLASNPDLDILAEARFIHKKHPDVRGETLLRMLTLSGAEALGWADETGSLTPGKSADLVVLPLPNEERQDPHDLVFESDLPVARTLWRGQWR